MKGEVYQSQKLRFWAQTALGLTAVISCMTLGKLLNLSESKT